jgi:hypothetical protein
MTMALFRSPVGVAAAALLLTGRVSGSGEPPKEEKAPALARIDISFKVDPRLTKGLYLGDRWASPPTFSIHQPLEGATVEARAQGKDATGRPMGIAPRWVPEDPEMVTVTPAEGKEVRIGVLRAGEGRLRLSADGVSRELTIKAVRKGETLSIEITQAPPAGTPVDGPDGHGSGKLTPDRREVGDRNKAEGEAFLAENAARDGVVTLGSGLQYRVLKAGAGRVPTADDTVVCHYRGTLLDGREFDSSYKRQKPGRFPLRRVIPGWREALQRMPTGSRWQLFVPPELAYGERGSRRTIGPNATLVFEVELLAIEEGGRSADEPGASAAGDGAPAPGPASR